VPDPGHRQGQRAHDAGPVLAGGAVHHRGALVGRREGPEGGDHVVAALPEVAEVGTDGRQLALVVLGDLPRQERLEPALRQVGRVGLLDGEDVGVVTPLGQQAEVAVGDLVDVPQRAAALQQDLRGGA
jgi:hypothetical protein